MKSNEEFKNEVYARFENYKAERTRKRNNIIKYGSIVLSVLIVALAVASPAFRAIFSGARSAAVMEDRGVSPYNVDSIVENKAGGSDGTRQFDEVEAAGASGENFTGIYEQGNDTKATSTPAHNEPPTVEESASTKSSTAVATVQTTAAATYSTTLATSWTPSVIPTEETNEKYDPSPDITTVGADNFGKYFVGIKIFSETGEAVAAENAENERGSGVKRYKYQTDDYDNTSPRKCFAVTVYGALIIDGIADDGETLTYNVSLHEFAPDPLRYINIFTVAGDRKIVFNFSELPTDQGGNE